MLEQIKLAQQKNLLELRNLIISVIVRGEVVLSSGKRSDFYIDARRISLNSRGAFLIGTVIFEFVKQSGFTAIAGLSVGADPIISSVITIAGSYNFNLKGMIIRKEAKEYGMAKQIEGPEVKKDEKILLVDDVATTGGSILKASGILRSNGYENVGSCIVLVDRQEGAEQSLAENGIELFSLFKKSELI